MSLHERLQRHIRSSGPMSVAHYMTLCMLDPNDGYYPTRDPIGAGADFITAPEISQMFGELIGIWLISAWENAGKPSQLHLAELGPGKGTMMSDILRAARAVPDFSTALQVHFIEVSAALIAVQAKTLGSFATPLRWSDSLADTGQGPLLVVANEYLDCLPVRQFIRQQGSWFERLVDCDEDDGFQFVLDPTPLSPASLELIPPDLRGASDDSLVEVRPGLADLFSMLAERAKTDPVAALFIDYGPVVSELGDTLQAVRAHKKVNPLLQPGDVDLTTRVDFAELARTARAFGFEVAGPTSQRAWLQQMGLLERAAALSATDTPQRAKIARQIHRLTDADEMGVLFQCLAIGTPGTKLSVGFDV